MSFPRYPKYKDSGVEWLGDIPSDWTVTSLKRVSSISYGIGEPPKYQETGTRLIRATNVSRGSIEDEGMVYVDPTHIPKQRIVWLNSGDIIVVRSGAYTGDSAIVPEGYGEAIAGFDMVMRLHGAVPKFVQFALLSNYIKDFQLELRRMRAAQPHLNAEELGETVFVAPPSHEQCEISSFLDAETQKIDALVSEQQRLIELLQEKRQAVISHAVTKGLNPNVPMKPSGVEWLGDVPEHWDFGSLKRFWEVVDCKHVTVPFYEEGYPVVSVMEVRTFELDLSRVLRTDKDSFELLIGGGRQPQKGDVIYCRNTANTGTSAYVGTDEPLSIGQDVVLIKSRCQNGRFLNYVLHSESMADQLETYMVGSTFKRINVADIRNLAVTCPPQKEQDQIVLFLDSKTSAFDSLIADAQRSVELLHERRTALISAAVTGKIDVRSWAGKALA